MSENTWRKMSIQEIYELYSKADTISSVRDEVTRAFRQGATFVFGVDKIKHGFRLTVNRAIAGIYLLDPSAKEFLHGDWPHFDAVVPDVARAGNIELHEYTMLFYVSPEEFEQFCREADQIFNEYFIAGLCFRMIPDLWFADTSLVKFIGEKLKPHPRLRPIFENSPEVTRSAGLTFSLKYIR